jgi:hypothetical protein
MGIVQVGMERIVLERASLTTASLIPNAQLSMPLPITLGKKNRQLQKHIYN